VRLAACAALWLAIPAAAQESADYFRQNCMSCHTIGGGRLTGPDLKGVTERQERDWLARFIMNPRSMIDSGDPYAGKLQQEARGVVMPALIGMTRERAEALLDLIEAESQLEESQFVGLQLSDRPFTPEDVALGRELFTGVKPLAGGGPPCISCHTVKGLTMLGGGRLGVDLTRVYERLEGRRNLAAWLFAPATQTMQPVFRDRALESEEILSLVALFEDTANAGGEDSPAPLLSFFLFGLGGAIAGLLLLDSTWKDRFRAVRRPLLESRRLRGDK
jgi:mono/diheme cytochrome c family protein